MTTTPTLPPSEFWATPEGKAIVAHDAEVKRLLDERTAMADAVRHIEEIQKTQQTDRVVKTVSAWYGYLAWTGPSDIDAIFVPILLIYAMTENAKLGKDIIKLPFTLMKKWNEIQKREAETETRRQTRAEQMIAEEQAITDLQERRDGERNSRPGVPQREIPPLNEFYIRDTALNVAMISAPASLRTPADDSKLRSRARFVLGEARGRLAPIADQLSVAFGMPKGIVAEIESLGQPQQARAIEALGVVLRFGFDYPNNVSGMATGMLAKEFGVLDRNPNALRTLFGGNDWVRWFAAEAEGQDFPDREYIIICKGFMEWSLNRDRKEAMPPSEIEEALQIGILEGRGVDPDR